MVLFKRGVPSERLPSPDEIYLVVEVSETTLKKEEGKKLLAYQGRWNSRVLDCGCCGEGSQDTPAEPSQNQGQDRALQAFPDVAIDLGNLF
jgi:hypothetical protein